MAQFYYNVGTASVSNGAKHVVFTGALLGTATAPNIAPGDWFEDPAQPNKWGKIDTVDYAGGTAELLDTWSGTTMASAAYRVWFIADQGRLAAFVRSYITALEAIPFVAASNAAASYFDLFEQTTNGSKRHRIQAPANLTADRALTLPDADLTISSFIAGLLANADAATARTTLGALTGALGSTDNRLLRSDGAGGVTAQGSAVTVDDSGNMSGVGTLVAGATALSGDLAIAKATPAITLSRAANSQYSVIYWADPSYVSRWALTGNNNSQHDWFLNRFNASGVYQDTPFSISGADGTMTLAKTLNLSAGQLAFPASQNASAGANTLDDYEKGTSTPGVAFGGGTTGITYGTRTGIYTTIGNLVESAFDETLTAKGSSTGGAALTGLPFTVATIVTAGNFGYWANMSSITSAIVGYASGTTLVPLNTGASTAAQLTDANFTGTSRVAGSAVFLR